MKETVQDYDLGVNFYCCMYPACGSEYTSKYNLKRHVESVHLKVKKFSCSICKNLFSSKQSLKEHYYKHRGAMPFRCITCDKSFRQASLLSLHKRVHNSQGTSLETSKSEFDISDMTFDKVEMDVKQTSSNMQILKKKYKIKAYRLPSNSGLKDFPRETSPDQKFSLRSLSNHIQNSTSSSDLKLFMSKDQTNPSKSRKSGLLTPLVAKSVKRLDFREDLKGLRSSSTSLRVEGFNVGSFFAKCGFTGKKPTNEKLKFPVFNRQKSVPKRNLLVNRSETEIGSGYKELYIQHLLRKKIKSLV